MDKESADRRKVSEIEYWNGTGGEHWVRRQEAWDRVLAPVSPLLLARAAIRPGGRIVDIGCGCGASTIELGLLAGTKGRVLGIDVSAAMLARARERLSPGLAVEFALADAATYAFPRGEFDLLFSRFGVMFFADPARAFANLRGALKPGGRLVFACFRSPKLNLWMTVPLDAAYGFVPKLPQPGPEDPGAFSFAKEERVRRILDQAGFRDIALAPLDLDFDIGGGQGLDAAMANALEIGPASRALEGQPPEARAAAAAAMRAALALHAKGNEVRLGAALWIVSATNL